MVSCLSMNFPTAVLTCMGLACRIDHAEKQAARCNYEQDSLAPAGHVSRLHGIHMLT